MSVVTEGGSTADANIHDPCPDAGPHRFLFVTNATFRGDLARDAGTTGRAAGDQRCNESARAAGLPGTYVAWLSTTTDHPTVRPMPGVAIVLPRACEVLAPDVISLPGIAMLPVAPSSTELGGTLDSPCFVWSNTTRNGTTEDMTSCEEWTSTDAGATGSVGACDNQDYEWTAWGARTCDNANVHLYCLEN